MGYDFSLNVDTYEACQCCGRDSESLQLYERYVSYNHSWAFYEHLSKTHGLRWIYHNTLDDVIHGLGKMKAKIIFINGGIPKLTDSRQDNYGATTKTIDGRIVAMDGWAKTVFNAYRCCDMILQDSIMAVEEGHETAKWSGD